MWRRKKVLIVVVLAAVLLLGSLGGVALADDDEDEISTNTVYDRVAAYLVEQGVDITSEQLKEAFAQVRSDIRAEALENRLAKMIENGVIDETQAQEFQDWWNTRPDMLDNFGVDFGGRAGFRGMHGMHGFGGLCAPE